MSEKTISIEKLQALIGINSILNSNFQDADAVLSSILESAKQVVDCEAASILLNRKDIGALEFSVCLGPKNKEVKKIIVDKKSIAGWVVDNCKSLIVNDPSSDPRFNSTVQDTTKYMTKNMVAVPLKIQGEVAGVIEVINKARDEKFTEEDLQFLEILGEQAGLAYRNALKYKKDHEQLAILQTAQAHGKDYHPFIAKNPQVLSLLENIKQASSINSSVLITGESGVGKELFAEQVHLLSNRHDKPFVRVSCASLSPSLLESELFGHVKGSFTDALSDRKGRFESADGGTLFLDEIGELPLNLQAKLLRVLQERKFERVGSNDTISVDVRIIAATNRNLEAMIAEGTFRKDLYFRLNVLPLAVPPLRERKEEIPDLCMLFLEKFKRETNKNFIGFSEKAKEAIYSYMWPGNVRELENTIERACIIGRVPFITVEDLRLPLGIQPSDLLAKGTGETNADPLMPMPSPSSSDKTLKTAVNEFKKKYITQILIETNWNQTTAAKILDVQRTYVSKLINELGIQR